MQKHWIKSKADFECFAEKYLNEISIPSSKIIEGMKYCLLGDAKRLRALIVYIVSEMLNIPETQKRYLALSIESIHAYSLVHDDLPSMDDDTVRRNKPTCHIKFNEATAILVGDALQTFAFEVLSELNFSSVKQAKTVLKVLSNCSGASGMISGQQLDIDYEGKTVTALDLEEMHSYKTGKLFVASVMLPFYFSDYSQDKNVEKNLKEFAKTIGLCFQIKDDILDITADTASLGKNTMSDIKNNKSTYPSLLGIDKSQALLESNLKIANKALENIIDFDTSKLENISNFIATRKF